MTLKKNSTEELEQKVVEESLNTEKKNPKPKPNQQKTPKKQETIRKKREEIQGIIPVGLRYD